ncbi:MAG: hypothetical protein JWM68_3766 [Verrucomicrobiales bacterium]|nr:hypothetical protein [Verrucomicrobiales bacterium]
MEGMFHDLDAEVYHGAPGCSHSMLKHMDPPARLPAYLAEKREPTTAMIMGTLVHSMVLEPDKPLPKIAVKPEGMKFSTNEGKEWRKKQDGLLILTAEEFETLSGCVSSISKHPEARACFLQGTSEVSCFVKADSGRAESVSLFKKCRIDWVSWGDCLADVKTVQHECAGPDEFSKILFDMRYYTQAAWYLDIYNALNPERPKKHFVFIAVEKKAPYLVAVYYVREESIALGRKKNAQDFMQYVSCGLEGKWPGFDGVNPIGVPQWAMTRENNKENAEWMLRVAANQL